MTEISPWTIASSVSAAIAACAALVTVIISIHKDTKIRNEETLSFYLGMHASIVLVNRSLTNAVRDPNDLYCEESRINIHRLLESVGAKGAKDSEFSGLIVQAESCLEWIDEMRFNDFTKEVKQKTISEHELKFRKYKHLLESKLGINHG